MKLGKVNGIDVHLHWSVWMIVLFYLISTASSGGLVAGLFAAGVVSTILACVVAHEFGHATAAARFGIRTVDISLYAFGGIARLASLPKSPIQELVVAVAGPAVNVGIAIILTLLMVAGIVPSSLGEEGVWLTFADYVLYANVFLVLFNMLPAFPMDGGRVLRSLLSMRMGHLKATEIAARIGRWMALGFVVGSIYWIIPTLFIVAVFIFLAGTAELMQVRVREMGSPIGGAGQAGGNPFQFPGAGPGATFQWSSSTFPGSMGSQNTGPSQDAHMPPHEQDPNVIDAPDVRHLN